MLVNGDTTLAGFTPDHIGFRKGKRIEENKDFIDYCVNYALKDKYHPDVKKSIINNLVNIRETYAGSIDTNMGHLRAFFDNSELSDIVIPKIHNIIKLCASSPWFEFPEVDLSSTDDMEWVTNYNPNSNPGHYTSKVFNTNNKRSTIDIALLQAKEMYDIITTKPTRNFCLWDVLTREKDFKVGYNVNESYSTRVVMNPEHYVTVLLSWITRKFQYRVEHSSDKPNMLLDKEYNNVKGVKIMERISDFDYIVDADWSKFDSSQYKEYLIAASCLLFSNSISSKKDARIFYYYCTTLVTKYVAVPPGIVVELNKGLPSGHPGVTLINCIVNLIRWAIIGYVIYGKNFWKYMDIIVYGDDALVAFKDTTRLSMIDDVCARYGFKGDNIYERLYPVKLIYDRRIEQPDFLKRFVSDLNITWNPDKVIQKLMYPSRKRTIEQQIELINNYIATADDYNILNKLLYKYRRYLSSKYKVDVTPIRNIVRKDFRLYDMSNKLEGYKYEQSILIHNECINLTSEMREVTTTLVRRDPELIKVVFYMSNNRNYLKELRKEFGGFPFQEFKYFKRIGDYVQQRIANYPPLFRRLSVDIDSS